jgi:uncharacterized protein (TIGR02611 family)
MISDPPDPTIHERFTAFGDRLEDAAIEAEFETGYRELSEKAARSNIFIRIARITVGFVLIVAGIIMLIIPGPGLVAIAGGLALWSRDFVWAERTLRYVRKKAPGIPEDGSIPLRTWVSMGIIMGSALALTVVLPRFIDFGALWADIF